MPSVTVYVDLIGVPHAFIKIVDGSGKAEFYGYGPAQSNTPFGAGALGIGLPESVTGIENKVSAATRPQDASYVVSYEVSTSQLTAMLGVVGTWKSAPGTYLGLGRNCVTFVREVLNAGAVPHPDLNVIQPLKSLPQALIPLSVRDEYVQSPAPGQVEPSGFTEKALNPVNEWTTRGVIPQGGFNSINPNGAEWFGSETRDDGTIQTVRYSSDNYTLHSTSSSGNGEYAVGNADSLVDSYDAGVVGVAGAVTNAVSVTTSPNLTPRLDNPDDPTATPNADGTALGSLGGTYQVSLTPAVLNTNTDLASAIFGDSGTGGTRPGNENLSGTGAQLSTISNWGDALDQALSANASASTTNTLAATTQNAGVNVPWVPADPLILDLNGDGVRLTSYAEKTVLFDIDNDGGSKEQTGWVAANTITVSPPAINTDGILVWDPNNTGLITNISQTISEYFTGTVGSSGVSGSRPFANGFAALKSLDLNGDNLFTSADTSTLLPNWSSVKVWVDDNADGVSFKDTNGNGVKDAGEASELKTFAELGITSINLVSTTQSGLINGGNEVQATGNFVIGSVTREAQAANFLANPNGHGFINQTNGANTGTKITTEGVAAGSSVLSYISHATVGANNLGETMSTATLGVTNLYGGAGNDTLTGDANANWLAGGAGSDTFNAGAGDDVLLIDASDLQANIKGGAGNDIAQVVGNAGVTLNLTQAEVEIAVGGRGNDVLIGGGRSSVFIRAGDGDDIVIGGAANDVLSGENGDDLIDGGAGNDLIRGHRGRDVLLGGVGDDILDGGLDDDRLSGGDGNDVLKGAQGDDVIDGGGGIDIAELSGSFADYRLTQLVAGVSGQGGTWRVVDTRANRTGGNDGADTLTGIEKLNFADLSAVDITLDNSLPVKDVVQIDNRTGTKLISVTTLLANDRDWQGDALHITTIDDIVGGWIVGTNASGATSSTNRGGIVTPTLSGGQLQFNPDASYTGVMSFKYKIADALGTPGATALANRAMRGR